MARIAGVDLPKNKRIDIALRSIYGIGPKISGDVCRKAGVPRERRTDVLTDQDVIRIGLGRPALGPDGWRCENVRCRGRLGRL